MATNKLRPGLNPEAAELLTFLASDNWSVVLQGIEAAGRWLREAPPGDPLLEPLVSALAKRAAHPKWEVRRGIANLAASTTHLAFEPALARFASDDNEQVRVAARRAALRRRDWQNASAFGKQHEERINALLDDIQTRFGLQGREAVKRVGEQVADTFARELYHEVTKLIAPIANTADRLKIRLADPSTARADLEDDATTIGRRVAALKATLDAMRAYTAVPKLSFSTEDVRDIVLEALAVTRENTAGTLLPTTLTEGGGAAEVCRARIVQALTNVLHNAVEAYTGDSRGEAVRVKLEPESGRVAIVVEDFGCGMSEEVLADATLLFTTNKARGTGFGLPLAKRIIESEHGGRLTLSSKKGHGTAVRITIPTRRTGTAR